MRCLSLVRGCGGFAVREEEEEERRNVLFISPFRPHLHSNTDQ